MVSGSPSGPLSWAHPIVQTWFERRFGAPTEPQEQGWPHILAGRSTLLCAPTGSGKTLAAFLICIDRLVRQALAGELRDQTSVLYVSPLKALGNDIQKNLEAPLAEICQIAVEQGLPAPGVRTAVRSGDTLAPERRAMLKRPPHILVTTPESLYILLTAEKSRAILGAIETVIVDEIHAVADDKRGAHLALTLERLDHLTAANHYPPPVRIGLSATQKPIELVAQFLVGTWRPAPVIVDVGHHRPMDLGIEVPGSELGPVASNEMWNEVYDRLAVLARAHRSTLVFVNTRRWAERIAHHLAERLGEDAVAAHHGSLARKLRLEAERKLKSGEARVLVATASLELGIDIGTVDLVCQIGSTRSIGVALQRVGRAGHWRGAVPKGRIFAQTRDELMECGALVRAIRRGELDRLQIPEAPLDILAQQIVAACAGEDWSEQELYALIRRAYPYRNLSPTDFEAIVKMLSDGISARRGRYGAYLHRDQVGGRLRARRGSRMTAITNAGAIPQSALYTVIAEPHGVMVGTVDEDFAVESLSGDVMLLGSTSWRIRRIESAVGRVLVEDAQGAAPNIPFWRGEAPARTEELSRAVAELRAEMETYIARGAMNEAIDWLKRECGLQDLGAGQLVDYVAAGRAVLGAVPTQTTIVAERFFDEAGGMQLVIHAPFGGRINKAWGLALRKRFCRSFNFELQAAATEDGINISLGEQHSFPLADVFHFLHPSSFQSVLEQAALASPLFGTRFRWDATRALCLPRFRAGNKVPLHIQRIMSDDLLAAVFPDAAACQENIQGDICIPDHPLIREVMKDVLSEAMDVDGLRRVLGEIADGQIRCLAVDTPLPSQFSHEILNANPFAYLDDAPLEERRARAVSLRRTLPEAVLTEIGRLDPKAMAQVRQEAWPDVRDADELDDALQTLGAIREDYVPAGQESVGKTWGAHFAELAAAGRAARAVMQRSVTVAAVASAGQVVQPNIVEPSSEPVYWVPASRARDFAAIYPHAALVSTLAAVEQPARPREEALRELVRGWVLHIGPTNEAALAATLALPATDVQQALLALEAQGVVLRGQYTGTAEMEWCERRLLGRIHRLTVGILRREIEPVTPAAFMRWLLRWQHVAKGTQVSGERGLLEVLHQLQGFEAPASAWEREILARRVAGYDPGMLDRLCLAGAVGWGRVSPHPAFSAVAGDGASSTESGDGSPPNNGRRVVPTSVVPITFFVRDDCDWMAPRGAATRDALANLSHPAGDVHAYLEARGASFFADIVRGTGRLKSEVEMALWELVSAGLVTADGFDNLRAFLDPKRRAGQGSGRSMRPRNSTGRWSLLFAGDERAGPSFLESVAQVLLGRYGVVFRDLLARESFTVRWRELLVTLRRLEDRGEVRGGRFVDGFLGEQFALPLGVESLRASRKSAPDGEGVTVAAADPLNLAGIILPGERIPAHAGRAVTFRDGVTVTENISSAITAALIGSPD